jgi:triosephosphate isomerase
MHHDHIEALHMVRDLGLRLKPDDVTAVDVSVHPPFTDLRTVQTLVEKEGIPVALGAQHSERRTLFGMTDVIVAATLKAVLRHDMTPIVCVGETEEERARGKTEATLEEQVLAALDGLSPEVTGGLVLAYEPLWAIGTGQAASAMDAEDACVFIRSLVGKAAGEAAAETVRIQYGGSVQAENATDLMAEPNVDGLLVGGASLQAASFLDVIRACAACYRS